MNGAPAKWTRHTQARSKQTGRTCLDHNLGKKQWERLLYSINAVLFVRIKKRVFGWAPLHITYASSVFDLKNVHWVTKLRISWIESLRLDLHLSKTQDPHSKLDLPAAHILAKAPLREALFGADYLKVLWYSYSSIKLTFNVCIQGLSKLYLHGPSKHYFFFFFTKVQFCVNLPDCLVK